MGMFFGSDIRAVVDVWMLYGPVKIKVDSSVFTQGIQTGIFGELFPLSPFTQKKAAQSRFFGVFALFGLQ